MSLDGFSMHPLAVELDHALAGGRIDRIAQPNKHSVVLSVRQPGRNLLLLISIHSQNPSMHLLARPMENPPEPPVFCMVLRKQIAGGRIAGIRQHGLDRLLFMDIDTVAEGGRIVTRTLAVELMGKYSNLVLLEQGMILEAMRRIGTNRSRVRTVLPGQAYDIPPVQDKLDLFQDSLDEILGRIQSRSDMQLSKAILDCCMGFGPVSAKETVFRAGLSPQRLVGELGEGDRAALRKALAELRDACADCPEPCLLLGEGGKVLAMAAFPLRHREEEAARKEVFPDLSSLLERADRLVGSYVLPDKDRFRRLVRNELQRATKKLGVLQQELEAAENAQLWRVRADNLMTYRYQFQDHADQSIQVADIYSETGEAIEIPLDRRITIAQNVQALYRKYDKLKRAQELLQEQIEKCRAEAAYLSSIEASLEASSSLGEIDEIHRELVAGGYLREKQRKPSADRPAKPFSFHAPDGTEILVGKNNYQNDKLTFRTAAYNDLWLHAKEIPGSHVILRCGGSVPSEETLLLAAGLAAHFSKAQASSKVPVDYTECRYVKKPSGAKPGFVIFTNQKTLYVTPEETGIADCLARAWDAQEG